MELLKEEFSRLTGKDGQLYTDGFTPEQIFYQLQELCDSVLECAEEAIGELMPLYEKAAAEDEKICSAEEDRFGPNVIVEKKAMLSDEESADEEPADEESADEEPTDEESADEEQSSSYDASDGDESLDTDEISKLPANKAMKLLCRKINSKKPNENDPNQL
jgi:hypothetical protein